jgi:hypothetical protein
LSGLELGIPGVHTWGAIFRKYGTEIVQKRPVIPIKKITQNQREEKMLKKKLRP